MYHDHLRAQAWIGLPKFPDWSRSRNAIAEEEGQVHFFSPGEECLQLVVHLRAKHRDLRYSARLFLHYL
jgi:hypothetical protein